MTRISLAVLAPAWAWDRGNEFPRYRSRNLFEIEAVRKADILNGSARFQSGGLFAIALVACALAACSAKPAGPTAAADAAKSAGDVQAGDAADKDAFLPDAAAADTGSAADVATTIGLWTQIAVPGNPNMTMHSVWSDSTTRVLAAGTGGTILGYDGSDWSVLSSDHFASLNAISAAPGVTTGFAVGIGGTVVQASGQDGKPGKVWGAPGGCQKPADCNDNDTCTTDVCESGTCVHSASGASGCCGGAVFGDSFDKGLGNWSITDSYAGATTGGVVWSAAAMTGKDGGARFTSPPAAAYFGRSDVPCPGKPGIFCPTFDNGKVVGATLLSKEFTLPKAMKVLLSFQLLLDVQEGYYDQVQVSVQAPGGKVVVWDKYQQVQSGTTDGAFKLQTVDLTQFAGQKLRIEILFNSISAFQNSGEGAYIDDLLVSTTCAPASTSGKGVTSATLFGVWASSDDNAWAVGEGGTILHWDGKKWISATSGKPRDIFGMGGSANGSAFVVGDQGLVATLSAVGTGAVAVPPLPTLRAVAVGPAGNAGVESVVAVGDGGAVLEGDGTTWKIADPLVFQGSPLRGVASTGDGGFVAVGGYGGYGQIFAKKPNGTWQAVMTTSGLLNAVATLGSGSAFAVGAAGLLVERNGDTWTESPGALGYDTVNAIHALSPEDIWVVGNNGFSSHYVAGTWQPVASQLAVNLSGVWAASGKDVFACGPLGSIVHYDGQKWSDMAGPPAVDWTAIWGRSSDEVYVGGKGGIVARWDGKSWNILTAPITATLRNVWGTAKDDVWAVGEKGSIYHFGGSGWSFSAIEPYEIPDQKPYKVESTLLAIWGGSKTDVWASGLPDADGHGTLVHYDGTSWKYVPALQTESRTVRAIWGWKSDRMLLAGTQGMVYLWNGSDFKQLHPQTIATFFGITGFGKDALLVGDIGTVLRFSPP